MRDWSPVMWQSLIYSSLININKSFHEDRHASGRFSHSHTHTPPSCCLNQEPKSKKKLRITVENHLVLFWGKVLKADQRTVCMLTRSQEKSSQTLLFNQVFDSPPMPFLHRDKCWVFLRVPIQIHPTFTVRISPVMKSISAAGGEYYICNVTNW